MAIDQKHYTDDERAQVIERVLDLVKQGLPEYAAAEQGGTKYTTWWRWKQDVPGLVERMSDAKMHRVPLLEDRLYKAAMADNCSVRALLALLEKYDEGWRNRARREAPSGPVFVFQGGAAAVIGMLSEEKRKKLLGSLHVAGLIADNVVDIEGGKTHTNGSANGSNGSAAH